MNKIREVIGILKNFISIDGGGTKTEVCVFNEGLELILHSNFEGININQIGDVKFDRRMYKIFDSLPLDMDYQMCIGIPGYGESSETDQRVHSVINKYIKIENIKLVNDVELAHYGSFGLQDGILILSGTGSMALSIIEGKKQRTGGWGFLIGDEGSAFSIGLEAINHLSQVFDNICSESLLFKIICENYKFDFPSKLINFVYSSDNYRKEIASLSLLVDEASKQGCTVAMSILEHAASQLTILTKPHPRECYKVSYAGSVFKSEYLREQFERQESLTLSAPITSPVLGGILKLLSESENNYNIEKSVISLNEKI